MTTKTISTRTVQHSDKSGTRVRLRCGDFQGTLIAVYDGFAWVLWDNAGTVKGCWQPDTHPRHDVFVME